MGKLPDIDVDFSNRDAILDLVRHNSASLTDGKKHNTGVYVTDIPVNPLTGNSTIDFKQAEDRGYFKLDFLNVNVYSGIKDEEHLNKLINKELVIFGFGKKELGFISITFSILNFQFVIIENLP